MIYIYIYVVGGAYSDVYYALAVFYYAAGLPIMRSIMRWLFSMLRSGVPIMLSIMNYRSVFVCQNQSKLCRDMFLLCAGGFFIMRSAVPIMRCIIL